MKNHVYMWLAHHSLRPKSKIAQSSSVELFVCRVEVKVWLLRRRCGGTPSAPSPAPPPWTPSSPSQSSVVDTLCPSFWIWFTSTTTPRVQMTKNVDPGRIAATSSPVPLHFFLSRMFHGIDKQGNIILEDAVQYQIAHAPLLLLACLSFILSGCLHLKRIETISILCLNKLM